MPLVRLVQAKLPRGPKGGAKRTKTKKQAEAIDALEALATAAANHDADLQRAMEEAAREAHAKEKERKRTAARELHRQKKALLSKVGTLGCRRSVCHLARCPALLRGVSPSPRAPPRPNLS